MKKIYVGNLSYQTTEPKLQQLFSAYGAVRSAKIITDRESGTSRGFGFVEMDDDTQAQAAIDGLNGTQLDGRTLTVNEARPAAQRSSGGPGGRGRGGGFRGGPRR